MKYKDTKLISFLSTFSKDELNDFEKYLSQQYFRQKRDVLPLYKVLKKLHPEFLKDDFSEEKVIKNLYRGSNYSPAKHKNDFRALSSYLLKSVEDYLFLARLRENKVLKNRILLKEILDRNLSKNYSHYLDKAYKEIKSDEEIYGFDILEKFHLERLNSRYYASVMDMKNYFRHSFTAFENISSHFWLDLISSAKLMLLGYDNMNIRPENDILSKLLNSVDMNKILKIYEGTEYYTYLYFYYNIYKCLENKRDLSYYQKAKKIFFDNKSSISRHDMNYFYADMIAVTLIGTESMYADMKKELFFVLKNCLRDKAYKLSDGDFMHPNLYRNCIICAEFLKEYDWADEFIKTYTHELNPEYRQSMSNYSSAMINYARGNYDKALEFISNISYEHAFSKTDVKILTLRIYYELNLYEQSVYLADTFKHHIKISPHLNTDVRAGSLNYINYYLKIFRIKTDVNKSLHKDLTYLKKQMDKEKDLIQKKWLNEKLEELRNMD